MLTDIEELRTRTSGSQDIGAIGIEAVAALRRAKIKPQYLYGVAEAAVEAVHCGLNFIIVCTEDAISEVIKRLQEEDIEHEITDLTVKLG